MHTNCLPGRAKTRRAFIPFAWLWLLAAALPTTLAAQTCDPGDVLLKNDILPGVPQGLTTIAIVPGLCENEAAMSVLDFTGTVTVRKVSALFGNQFGTNGVVAIADVEIYDGATMAPNGIYTLGPRVFRLSDGGSNLQISTHALNELVLPTPVTVSSGKLVVAWRILLNNAVGSCTFGYTSNLAIDNSTSCVPGRNIIDALPPIGAPVDPVTFNFPGNGPLCGGPFWRGDWIIRACVTPDVSVTWTGNATPGGLVALTLRAPNNAGENYLTLLGLGTSPGFNTPWGTVPLTPDFLLSCTLNPSCSAGVMINGSGVLNANGQAFPAILIPPLPVLANSGLTFYAAFVTGAPPGITPFTAISAPSMPIVIN